MKIVRVLASMILMCTFSYAFGDECAEAAAACNCPETKQGISCRTACYQAEFSCRVARDKALAQQKALPTPSAQSTSPSTNAAMPPPRSATPQAAQPATAPKAAQQLTPQATPKPATNWVTRPRELAESGICRANATACRGSCEGATANPGSAAGFKHMECVSQCVVTQAQCGQLAADVERGVRLPNGKCVDGSNGLCFHTNK